MIAVVGPMIDIDNALMAMSTVTRKANVESCWMCVHCYQALGCEGTALRLSGELERKDFPGCTSEPLSRLWHIVGSVSAKYIRDRRLKSKLIANLLLLLISETSAVLWRHRCAREFYQAVPAIPPSDLTEERSEVEVTM